MVVGFAKIFCDGFNNDPRFDPRITLVNADGSLFAVQDMQTGARGNVLVKHQVDACGPLYLLRPRAGAIAFGLVKRVGAMPQQGVVSMFSLCHSTGVLDGQPGLLQPSRGLVAASLSRAAGG